MTDEQQTAMASADSPTAAPEVTEEHAATIAPPPLPTFAVGQVVRNLKGAALIVTRIEADGTVHAARLDEGAYSPAMLESTT